MVIAGVSGCQFSGLKLRVDSGSLLPKGQVSELVTNSAAVLPATRYLTPDRL